MSSCVRVSLALAVSYSMAVHEPSSACGGWGGRGCGGWGGRWSTR